MFISFFRVIKFSILDILRNFSLSAMTVVVMTLLLISVNALLAVRIVTTKGVEAIQKKIDLSLYLVPSITADQLSALEEKIKSIPEVSDVRVTASEEALALFKKQYAETPEILSALDELGTNPLGPAIIVKCDNPAYYKKLIADLSAGEYEKFIEDKTFADTESAVEKITGVTQKIEEFVLALSILFGLIAVIIVFTTIRVAIYTERIEIVVKKLVGASDWFVRGPYIVEVIIMATVSLLLSYTTVIASVGAIDPYIAAVMGEERLLTAYFLDNILAVAGLEYAGVILVTIGTALIAMRRYLKA